MAVKKSRIFKDISLSFKPNPVTGDLNVLKNERAITRSVRNLVQTGMNERFYSDVGTDITDSLFNFVDEATGGVIAQQIIDTLAIFEPRVANTTVAAYPRPDDNSFEVTIAYEIVGLEVPRQEYSFILEATR